MLVTESAPPPVRPPPLRRERALSAFTVWSEIHLRAVLAQRGVAVLVVGGIWLGTSVMVGVLVMWVAIGRPFHSFEQAAATVADLQVTPHVDGRLPEDVIRDVRAVPGVRTAVPVVAGLTSLQAARGRPRGVFLLGTNCSAEALVGDFGCRRYAQEAAATNRRGAPLLVSRRLAAALGLRPGAGVGILGGLVGDAYVAGVVDARGVLAGVNAGYWAVGELTGVQTLLGTGPHLGGLLLDADRAAARRLRGVVGSVAEVGPPTSHTAVFVELTRSLLLVSSLLILFGGALVAVNSYVLSLEERQRVFALTTVLGAGRGRLVGGMLAEGALLGLVAGVLAVPGAYLTGRLFTTLFAGSMLSGTGAELAVGFEGWTAAAALAAGALAGAGAALPAAIRTVRQGAIIAVRSQTGIATHHEAPRWPMLGVVLVAAALPMGWAWGQGRVPFAVGFGAAALLATGLLSSVFGAVPLLSRAPARFFARRRAVGLLTSADMESDPLRWAAVATTIAGAMILLVGLNSMRVLTVQSMASAVERQLVHLVDVHPRAVGDQVTASFGDAALARIRDTPGVAAVYPQRLAVVRTGTGALNVEGTDPLHPRPHLSFERGVRVGEVWRRVRTGDVLVSRLFANRRGLRPGGTLTLPTTGGTRTFRVAAVVTSGFDRDNGIGDFVVAADEVAARHWGAGVDMALVAPRRGVDTAALARRLERSGVVGLRATDRSETAADAARNGGRFLRPVENMGYALVIIAAVGVANFFLISIAGRRRLLGMLRFIGYTPGVERRTLLAETATMGVFGLVFGILGAMLFSWFVALASPAMLASQVAWGFVPGAVLVGLVGCVVLCALGVAVPLARTRDVDKAVFGTDTEDEE